VDRPPFRPRSAIVATRENPRAMTSNPTRPGHREGNFDIGLISMKTPRWSQATALDPARYLVESRPDLLSAGWGMPPGPGHTEAHPACDGGQHDRRAENRAGWALSPLDGSRTARPRNSPYSGSQREYEQGPAEGKGTGSESSCLSPFPATSPGPAKRPLLGSAVPSRTPFQKESVEMTSPWFLDPSAQMMFIAVLALRNLTEPSAMETLPPPGW